MKQFAFALCLACPALAGGFTDQLWADIAPVYAKTLEHPFLRGLTAGTLPRERFQFYLLQDSHYLRAFAQSLSVLASKAPREEWAIILNQHAVESIQVERQLHESILGSYGVAKARAAATPAAPTNAAYANHLLVSVERATFTEGLAALLPCYWIYWEVGKQLKRQGSKNPDYQRWIDQYAGEDYGKTVRQVLDMMNEAAAGAGETEKRAARHLFERSARYEYMFWDMAWRMERWPPE